MYSQQISQQCAVLVPSCDAYSDLWQPYFTLFFRYWNDCPYPIYLGSNKLTFDHPRVQMIHTDQDTNWSNSVREQVKSIDAGYILLSLEDFFLQDKIYQKDIDYCLDFLISNNGNCIRMIQWPGPNQKISGEKLVGRINAGTPYRVSTQTAIWKKSSLLELIQPDESIWQFEEEGSKRSHLLYPKGFYATWKDIMTYKHHVVQRGKWFPWEAKKFAKMKIGCDFDKRAIMSAKEVFTWRKNMFTASVFRLIPYSIRKRIGGAIAEIPDI